MTHTAMFQFHGDWYVALHMGQTQSCAKFVISQGSEQGVSTVKEVVSKS